jgi:hypothetical protein
VTAHAPNPPRTRTMGKIFKYSAAFPFPLLLTCARLHQYFLPYFETLLYFVRAAQQVGVASVLSLCVSVAWTANVLGRRAQSINLVAAVALLVAPSGARLVNQSTE